MSTTIALWKTLTLSDLIVFLSTIIISLLAIIYGLVVKKRSLPLNPEKKQVTSWSEYLLMGRQLTLPLFVSTLVATWYGDILGVTQISFQYGVYSFVTQGFFWYISYILFAILLVKYIRKMQILSFPDLFAKLVGEGPGKFSAILIFLKTLPVTYAIGIGIFIRTLFAISFPLSVGLGLIFVFFYSLFGGFRTIVFSDLVQFICMYIGIISVVLFSFLKFGGISYLVTNCPAAHFSLRSNFSTADIFVWFFIAISTTFLNPTFYQRCLSARTDKIAVRGIFISIGCWILFDICTTLIGLYAKAYSPNAPSLNASLHYCLDILPNGFRGMFLGAVLSTILSTLDSFLFIASATLAYDLKIMNFKSKFLVHLTTSLVTGFFTFLIAIFYEGNFEMTWRMLKGIFAACIFPVFVLSCFKPNMITSRIFTISSISVVIAMIGWNLYKLFPIDAFYIGQFTCIIVLIFCYLWKRWNNRQNKQ